MSMKGDEAYILGMNYTEESLKGAGALKGEKGDPGKDGFSPIATVTKANGVSTFTVTDWGNGEFGSKLSGSWS